MSIFFRPGTGPCQGFTESRLHLGKAQASLALLSVCTAFRDSNTVTNRRASRMQNQTEFELCWGEACSRCEAATVRSIVLALSALHLTHSDTPPEGDFKCLFWYTLFFLSWSCIWTLNLPWNGARMRWNRSPIEFLLGLERLFFHSIVLCKNMGTGSCKAVFENSLSRNVQKFNNFG